VTASSRSHPRLRSLVDFGHGSQATVVAEGVETAQDAAALLELRVDLGQGWHFGRPGPADDLAPAEVVSVPAQAGVVSPALRA
jgi:EAL domain-containing protein (putative c-di-GMP-specific phosphodiesterase class I)